MPWWGSLAAWPLAALVVGLLFCWMIRLADRRTPDRPQDDGDPQERDDGG